METPTDILLILRETGWACIRHDVEYYPYFTKTDIRTEGRWYKKDDFIGAHVDSIRNLKATDRFEFEEDGRWAQVYLLVNLND